MKQRNNKKLKRISLLILFALIASSSFLMLGLNTNNKSDTNTQNNNNNIVNTINQGKSSNDPWWNNSWRYRVPINITSTSGNLYNYQVKINIALTDWYNNGYINASGSDIRFVNSSNQELSFWIEHMDVSGGNSTIWVKVPVISGNEKIYMYFGNPKAVSKSSISDTMDSGLRYFYYSGTNFGTYLGTDVYSSAPNFNWGSGTVNINPANSWENLADRVSIRWEGWVVNEGQGSCTFWVTTDDGSRLYVNNSLIINGWRDQASTEYSSTYSFSSIVPITYEWYENGGLAVSRLGWDPPNGGKVYPIPGTNLWNRKYSETEPSVSIGQMEFGKITVNVNAVDLYGNFIPYANISIYNTSISKSPLQSIVANENGSATFSDLGTAPIDYNFSVSIKSNIDSSIVELVNYTRNAIHFVTLENTINLTCDVSTHTFNVIDIDNNPVESGYIIVGNTTDPQIQNVTINNGQGQFWWVNTTPSYEYFYSVYYRDSNYNPHTIKLASGIINEPPNILPVINVKTNLTTVNFTVLRRADSTPITIGMDLNIYANHTATDVITTLTTDNNGQATYRWLNSSWSRLNNTDFSLSVSLLGNSKAFNMTELRIGNSNFHDWPVNYSISSAKSFTIWVDANPTLYQTNLISLNPSDSFTVDWGSQVTLRALFNVTKSTVSSDLGYNWADSVTYTVKKGTTTVLTGTLSKEIGNIGRYQTSFDTSLLNSATAYVIKISATKSGYNNPTDLEYQLYVANNEMLLNQSVNDDSTQTPYWSENTDMSVLPYGGNTENMMIQESLFQADNSFNFSVPNLENEWNLTTIVFNIYNITWNVGQLTQVRMHITDPYGVKYTWSSTDTDPNDVLNANLLEGTGNWTNLIINLNKPSATFNNQFAFTINGTFTGSVDVVASVHFERDHVKAQYTEFNQTTDISLASDGRGWAIQHVTFNIYNCYDTSTWTKVNPSSVNMKIVTNESASYNVNGTGIGTGVLTIDNVTVYPLNGQFLFTVLSDTGISFDVNISVEYIQEFYRNYHLENLNIISTQKNIPTLGTFSINAGNYDKGWQSLNNALQFTDIYNGTDYLLPSELQMNITIGTQTFNIEDSAVGEGSFSLSGFTPNQLYNAKIETNQPVTFNVNISGSFSRTVYYKTTGTVSYSILTTTQSGNVPYDSANGFYSVSIDTSTLDTKLYTVRFTVYKSHYATSIKDLGLNILERPTMVNGSSTYLTISKTIQVSEALNFTFEYNDTLTNSRLSNLDVAEYSCGAETGNLIQTNNSLYILDFNTASRATGQYTIYVTLQKQNYEARTVIIQLSINIREFATPILSNNFEGKILSIYSGDYLNFSVQLNDASSGLGVTGSTVKLQLEGSNPFNSNSYTLTDNGNGNYSLSTQDYKPLNQEQVYDLFSAEINVTRANYTSVTIPITIRIENRVFNASLPDSVTIYSDQALTFYVNLSDPINNNLPISGADVSMTFSSNTVFQHSIYNFVPQGSGNYWINISDHLPLADSITSKTFTATITINRTNYIRITRQISITVVNREFDTSLPGTSLSIYSDEALAFNITLTDPTNGDAYISGANVNMTFDSQAIFQNASYLFTYQGNGKYLINIDDHNSLGGSITSQAFTATITIKKTNYVTITRQISVIIKNREFDYSLSGDKISSNNTILIYMGETFNFQVLLDDMATSNPISGANVNFTFRSVVYNFNETTTGNYTGTIKNYPQLSEYELSRTFSGVITIEKANYLTVSYQVSVIIQNNQFNYELSGNKLTEDNIINIYTDQGFYLEMLVNDTAYNMPLSGVNVSMLFQGVTYGFNSSIPGNYTADLKNYQPLGQNQISATYVATITMKKDNFITRTMQVTIILQRRQFDYNLTGGNFIENFVYKLYSGESIQLRFDLSDLSRGGTALVGADINMNFQKVQYAFTDLGNGTYTLTINSSQYNAISQYLESRTFRADISINKSYYVTQEIQLAIVIQNLKFGSELSQNFDGNQLTIYAGQPLTFSVNVNDTYRDLRIKFAALSMNFQGTDYIFTNQGNGTYTITISNYQPLNASELSKTFTGNITLSALNFQQKNVIISVTIQKRTFSSILSANFKNQKVSVVKGQSINITITLTDPTNNNVPLEDAAVTLTLSNGKSVTLTEVAPGVYSYMFSTSNINAFFSSSTLTGTIKIEKENYATGDVPITIEVKMEEIFPGMPTFYFIMIVGAIAGIIGAIAIYRGVQVMRIPTFVKKVRKMKKAIKGRKSISESLLYPFKDEYISENYGDHWEELGLDLNKILGVEKKKPKTEPTIEKEDMDGGEI